jgi:rhodanese-related sulfurtransferase
MTKRAFKDAVYRQAAWIGKALASPKRLELLELLAQAPRTVEVLAAETEATVANTSQHLQILFAAGLVDAHKDGRFVIYRLADASVGKFLLDFRALSEKRRAEIDRIKRQFFAEMGEAEPVNQETLLERVRRGEALVLDVRPAEEFHHAHLVGAISLPLPELESRLSQLPKNKEVVAYCRGPFCVLAAEAVRRLRLHGIPAYRLEGSVYDLQALGLPTTTSASSHPPAVDR